MGIRSLETCLSLVRMCCNARNSYEIDPESTVSEIAFVQSYFVASYYHIVLKLWTVHGSLTDSTSEMYVMTQSEVAGFYSRILKSLASRDHRSCIAWMLEFKNASYFDGGDINH